MMLDSEPGTLTYALTQSRLERQARERAGRDYEPGLYRRYVAGDSVGDGATHWYEYDRDEQAERAVAAWAEIQAFLGDIRSEDVSAWAGNLSTCEWGVLPDVLDAIADVLREKEDGDAVQ